MPALSSRALRLFQAHSRLYFGGRLAWSHVALAGDDGDFDPLYLARSPPTRKPAWVRDRPFTLYKLRTMQHDCEKLTGPCWAIPNDPRVTVVGRFLRSTHMDELPQSGNVLRGEMSLIGPRPGRPDVRKARIVYPALPERRRVPPGSTGLAQLQLLPTPISPAYAANWSDDLHYIEKASFWLDCRILAGTVFKVLGLSCDVIRRSRMA